MRTVLSSMLAFTVAIGGCGGGGPSISGVPTDAGVDGSVDLVPDEAPRPEDETAWEVPEVPVPDGPGSDGQDEETDASPLDGKETGLADPGSEDPGMLDPGPPDPGGLNDEGTSPLDIVEDTGIPQTSPPDTRGPWDTKTLKTEVKRGNRTIPVRAYLPKGAGPWPLVVFLPGFQASLDLYSLTLDRIASHGFATVGAQPPGSPLSVSHVEMASDALAVVDWALDPKGPLGDIADPTRVAMVGHSLGGKVSVMAAYRDARIRAVVGLDPVNGGNPLTGYSKDLPDIVPDQVAPLVIPLGFLGEDWSATHASFGQSCAPADQNYRTFYEAAKSSPWKARWTFGGADHMDFVDNPSQCGFVCSVCPDGPGDDASQVAGARTLVVAFLRRHLSQETAMEAWLIGDLVPSVVTELAHAP